MPPMDRLLEVHLTYRFMVMIEGITYAAFTECTLPSLQVETQEIKEGGQNTYSHKLPVRINPGNVTLRHGITRSSDLLHWYLQVLRGEITNATRDVSVVMYTVKRQPVITWTFYNAYPVKWGGPTLKSDNNAVAIEELELVHHGFEIG
jgi:phage tail-like protein